MALEIRQNLKLTQSLIMTQKLQQAIKLLQLSRLELEGEIQQVLETNPVLEDAELQFEEKPVADQEPEHTGGLARRRTGPGSGRRHRRTPSHPWKNGTGTAF